MWFCVFFVPKLHKKYYLMCGRKAYGTAIPENVAEY